MSIVLQGSTSGSITLQEPAIAGSTVLSLPATTGTVLTSASPASDLPSSINGPAFSVYSNANQTGLTSGTFTKVAFNAEFFDTANCFDTSLYRFTPNVAGYYQINFSLYLTASNLTAGEPFIYKNGNLFASGTYLGYAIGAMIISANTLMYLNGSTDYIDFYGYATTSAGTYTINQNTLYNFANGCLVRSA